MPVPFVDLQAQYRSIKAEVDAAVQRVLDTSAFVLGREVEAFERAFAEYVGARECVGVSNGTAAIQLALQALGVGAGDEVIVPANTFFATAEAVSTAGATPVFVDCDPATCNIDPGKIEAAVTRRTRAVVPVHLYGRPADLDAVLAVAGRHSLLVVEDAAQAHGARYRGRRVGALARAGCFSFYPGKNLGAYGEGGAVVTNDAGVARRVRMLRDHGSEQKYRHEMVGYNFRLEGIQGAVLGVKLPRLDGWNELRRAHAARYRELLAPLADAGAVALPPEADGDEHVYHLFVVQSSERDALQRYLSAAGVQTGIHYPVPVHLQPAYAAHGHREGDFPHAERLSRRALSLPMYAELTERQLRYVADAVSDFYAEQWRAAGRG
ncbi:MAG TPA: DegT/DnrJ/EryC1/StrS family aminotransferase [Pyrinomonadaceae bacterium]